MKDLRCENCGKLLLKKDGSFDTIEIKCNRCGYIQKFNGEKKYVVKDKKGNEIGNLTFIKGI
jgi:phage FluMu protein Com